MMIQLRKIIVMHMKYGADILIFKTNYPEPLLSADPMDTLDLTARAPRMKGEAYVRQHFSSVEIEVMDYTEKAINK